MTRKRSKSMNHLFATAAIAAAGVFGATGVASAEPFSDRHRPYDNQYYDYDDYYQFDRQPHGTVHGGMSYDRNGDGVLSHRERLIEHFDRNHDGRLDRRERLAYQRYLRMNGSSYGYGYGDPYGGDRSTEHLDEHDRNGDGILDHHEMRELHRHDQMEEMFQSYDRDADGYLSWGEASRTSLRRHFRSADHDTDGYLSWNELEHYLEAPEQHRPIPRRPTYRWSWRGGWGR